MIHFESVLIFCTLICFSKSDYCQDNFTLSELPGGILKETLSILTTGTINGFVGCPKDTTIDENEIKLWLFTRDNAVDPVLLDRDNVYQLDASKSTKILAPGWLCDSTNDRMPELVDAYLTRYDCNVIVIDWKKYSIDLYTASFCKIPLVAKLIGKYLCDLKAIQKPGDIHILGHSMGGQMAGFIGQEVQSQCNDLVGRITALDPAGPLYQPLPASRRLDKTDARFVDVIHTNQGVLGFTGACGNVDFYPNGGFVQKGCFNINISDLIHLPVKSVGCNHLRAPDYMAESVNSHSFVARSCHDVLGICVIDLTPSKAVMGENCALNPVDKAYTLTTNPNPPFAKG